MGISIGQLAIYTVFGLLLIPPLYLFTLTLSAAVVRIFRRGPTQKVGALGHLAVVIPAHNEASCIQETLLSVLATRDDNFSVHVIADNCTDNTAQISRQAFEKSEIFGVVWERSEPNAKSKGEALAWLMSRLGQWGIQNGKEIEFVLFLDADCTLSSNSIELARTRFLEGALALQSEIRLEESPFLKGRLTQLGFAAMNIVRGLGRSGLNWGDTLKGTGFWIRFETLDASFWGSNALAEDMEYSIKLFHKGIKVHFLKNSQVLAKQPVTQEAFRIQRTRWESGRFALVKHSLGEVTRTLIKAPTLSNINFFLEFIIPPLGLLFTLYFIGGILLPGYLSIICIIGNVLLVFHIVGAIFIARLPIHILFSLLVVPAFIFWKLALIPSMIFASKNRKWIKTPRS